MRILFSFILLLFSLNPAAAAMASGNTIYGKCEPGASAVDQEICGAYIIGLSEGKLFATYLSAGYFGMDPKKITNEKLKIMTTTILGYCPPNQVTTFQMKNVVVDFMVDEPRYLHETVAQISERALSQAFPCN